MMLHPCINNMTPKGTPVVVLYNHITQLRTHTTNIYIAAAAYSAIILSFLTYCRG